MASDPKKPYGPDADYADPGYQDDGVYRYPLNNADRVRAAWSYVNMPKNASKYSADQLSAIKGRIKAAAAKFGIEIEGDKEPDNDADDKQRSIPKGTLERRVFNFTEVRTSSHSATGQRRMVGHAAVFNTLSEEMRTPFGQDFREVIRPGAFTKTLRESEVFALFNHNPDMPLARSANGSLFLHEDKRGLAVEITPTDTSYARDLLTNMDAGLINKMSFSFGTVKDEWRGKVRELQEVTLRPPGDISPVVFPAYTDTDIQARSLLTAAGLAFEDLSAVIFKEKAGVPLTLGDRDLIKRSIDTLNTYLTPEPGQSVHSVSGHPGSVRTHQTSVLRRRLELVARSAPAV